MGRDMAFFTTFDGLKLAYSDHGHGPPVLCLAGLTRNGSDFDYVAPHLQDVRMIRLDYRGRGQSDWAPDHSSYTIPTEALDVLALLDHLGLDKVAILGTSRGGLIAMMLAATAHTRLAGVCLNDIGPMLSQDGLDQISRYLGRKPTAKTFREMAAVLAATSAGFANVPEPRWLAEAQKRTIETPGGLVLNYDAGLRDAVAASGTQPTPDLWPLFDALNGLPLALIRGANSNLLSRETTLEMRKRRPDMLFADIPDRGHVPFLDEPGAVDVLTRWLEACK